MTNPLKRLLAIIFITGIVFNAEAQVKTKTFTDGIPNYLFPATSERAKIILLRPPPEFYKLKQQEEKY